MTTAAPDPRFRDQLAKLRAALIGDLPGVYPWYEIVDPWLAPDGAIGRLIAAEVEARVQAAANQRAAEVRRALAWAWLGHEPHTRDWDGPRSDEALEWADGMLAHPALADALAAAAQPGDGRTGE